MIQNTQNPWVTILCVNDFAAAHFHLTTDFFYWLGPFGFILCHLGLPNEFQHPKDLLNPFTVETFISAYIYSSLNYLSNPQPIINKEHWLRWQIFF
jgi:hypothetical protein